ncbi:sialidase family protein [Spirosoma montaniterrae]|uniref:Glycosyl hydrolase n=1 Tax=Spirosoma montaniterrae TaxID=1178516 RepID=A0A1P9WW23_9BACT|nr:sialidase family protein [Spirosoma montaniterrae]AQG79563.1 glycosyl hydrolase [Spirosoma montaniterrae]
MKNIKSKAILIVCFLVSWSVIQAQTVPGNIVCYEPSSSQKYIGSPSLVTLPNGDYVASHDFFGPKSSEWQQAVSRIYTSNNKGKTWRYLTEINGAFWSSLFVHKGELYLLGPDRHHGTVLIRKSTDGGNTWTKPTNKENGVLLTGEFHCAPMPVMEYNGRLWRPMETAHGPVLQWGKRYGAMVMSAPVDSDLMNSKSWQSSTPILYDSTFNNGDFAGWLEGNFVVDKDQKMWDMLRVANKKSTEEKAAMVSISPDGKALDFDPKTGFIPFDGGSKKFVIKYDTLSKKYWTLVNIIPDKYRKQFPERNPSGFRNILMLKCSADLKKWDDVKVILEHEDVIYHGFQYVDWSFEGNDIIVLSRTAYFDGITNAKNNHDANYLTFHRVENFRKIKSKI